MPRLALALLLAVGCAAPDPALDGLAADGLVDSRRGLVSALTARGWFVEPTAFTDEPLVSATGTAYRVRQRGGDARTVLVFEAARDDDGAPDEDGLGRDLVTLRRRLAGGAAVFYRRPGLVVVTFPRGRTALDLRLDRLLGPPVAFTEDG